MKLSTVRRLCPQTTHLNSRLVSLSLVLAALTPVIGLTACGGSDDSPPPVTVSADWNTVAATAWLQLEANAGAPITPHYEARSLAMANAVIHDVLNAIDRRYLPYAFDRTQTDASPDAAVAQAAHDVLVADAMLTTAFPAASQKAYLDAALATDLAKVTNASAKASGIALGQAAAQFYLTLRAADAPFMTPFGPNPAGNGTLAGQYQYTVPFNSPGAPFNGGSIAVPDWKKLKPFVLTSTTQFVPPGPYSPTSAAFATDLAEVTTLGAATGSTRTADQTQIAQFYSENSPLFWNRTARTVATAKGLDGWQSARLYAMLQLSLADAYIVYSQVGEQFNFWRPVTAIHSRPRVAPGWHSASPSRRHRITPPVIRWRAALPSRSCRPCSPPTPSLFRPPAVHYRASLEAIPASVKPRTKTRCRGSTSATTSASPSPTARRSAQASAATCRRRSRSPHPDRRQAQYPIRFRSSESKFWPVRS